jgi:hypothetical protein
VCSKSSHWQTANRSISKAKAYSSWPVAVTTIHWIKMCPTGLRSPSGVDIPGKNQNQTRSLSIKSDDIVQDILPGFRVLLQRVLAKEWLFVVRETTVLNKNDTLELLQKKIIDQRRIVAELSTGREQTIADARISFYEALEIYRRGDRLRGATQLSKTTPILAEDDAYYVHLQKLMQSDAE